MRPSTLLAIGFGGGVAFTLAALIVYLAVPAFSPFRL